MDKDQNISRQTFFTISRTRNKKYGAYLATKL
jgi:hypothetical protein